jgi:transglutaminase-like putative cysteine protease/type IV secretory pathway VirB3-like protein
MATTSTSPAQPLPAEPFFRVALFLLVLTSVLTLVSTGKLDIVTTIVAPLAILYKGFRWWQGHGPELRQSTATRLLVLWLFVFPLDAIFVSRNLSPGTVNASLYAVLLASVHFLLLVTTVRLYSANTDRDAIFLSMLSFAGMLAAAVFTVDTNFFFLFVAYLLFAVATFLGMEIRRSATGAVFPPMHVEAARERRFYRAISLAALSVAGGAVAIGSVLFFFFPRVNAGYFARTGFQPSLMTGFSDSVELGQIGEIKKDSTVVMRVRTGKPVGYPLLRWRGIALSTFDGHRWSSHDMSHPLLLSGPDGWINLAAPGEMQAPIFGQLSFTVLLQPLASDAIFVPGHVLVLRGNFRNDPNQRPSALAMDSAGSIYNPAHNYVQIRYDGLSLLPMARPQAARFAGREYPEEIRNVYLQLPEKLDRRIPELARKITASANNPYDKALLMESYLQRNFGYTLNLAGKPGADPLAQFLFVTKAGHCEYFASAMAVMLRTLNIPSREVNGFLPGEFNDVAGDYIVRASDAHSWVEAYFPGTGWLTFDPTPAANPGTRGLFSRLNLYLDWMQLNWNEWVVNYDFAHQLLMAKNVQRNSTDYSASLRAWFRRMQDRGMSGLTEWQRGHSALRLAFPVALVLLLAVLRFNWIPALFRWLSLALQMRKPAERRDNPQLASRLYMEMLRVLERRGFARPETQTAGEFAATFAPQPGLGAAVNEFTSLYAEARFGGAACDAFRLRALLEEIRAAAQAKASSQ